MNGICPSALSRSGGLPGGSRCRWLATQDHAPMMQSVGINEVAVGGKAGVVPVLDTRAFDFVPAFIGSLNCVRAVSSSC